MGKISSHNQVVPFDFDLLPTEIKINVSNHLLPMHLIFMGQTSFQNKVIFEDNNIWLTKCARYFDAETFLKLKNDWLEEGLGTGKKPSYDFWKRQFHRYFNAAYEGLDAKKRLFVSIIKEDDCESFDIFLRALCKSNINIINFVYQEHKDVPLIEMLRDSHHRPVMLIFCMICLSFRQMNIHFIGPLSVINQR